MTEPTMEEHFELSDVEVDTLGLVSRGANREDFFLLKSADKDEKELLGDNLWRKFIGIIRKAVDSEDAALANPEAVPEPTVEEEKVATAETTAVDNTTDPVKGSDTTESATDSDPTESIEVSDATGPTAVEPEIQKELLARQAREENKKEQHPMEDTNLSESTLPVTPQGEYVSKADHDALVQELEVVKSALAKAQEDKERAVFLAKAQDYVNLPVSPSELADHMYWLSKADSARYEWFTAVIKALDNSMRDTGLFLEKGNSAPIENDALSAALKSEDPKAALLALDRKSAESYLRSMRKALREA